MTPRTLIIRLVGVLLVALLAGGTETAAAVDGGPCEERAGCWICEVKNADCEIAFCDDHIHTDCF